MAFPSLTLPNTSGVLGLVCAQLSRVLDAITAKTHLDSIIVSDVVIKTGAARNIAHKLGRKPAGWKVTKRNANAVVWQSDGAAPELFLYLHSSADVTVDLEVF